MGTEGSPCMPRMIRMLRFLCLLSFVMSVIALVHDWYDFVDTPWYVWILIPICPLYPFLLGVCYLVYLRRGFFPRFLTLFTFIGITSYGVMALLFYPLYMLHSGFAWYELGNIFWVMIYASQAFLLARFLRRVPWWHLAGAMGYFLLKDLSDAFGVTFSYVRYEVLTVPMIWMFFVVMVVLHLAAGWYALLRSS